MARRANVANMVRSFQVILKELKHGEFTKDELLMVRDFGFAVMQSTDKVLDKIEEKPEEKPNEVDNKDQDQG